MDGPIYPCLCGYCRMQTRLILTDGLDGLAIVPVIVCAVTFAVFAYIAGHKPETAEYLTIPLHNPYLPNWHLFVLLFVAVDLVFMV